MVAAAYASWVKMVIDLIAPKNLMAIIGRATGKTTDITADRAMDVCYDMPGAYLAWLSDTYMNAFDNVIPSLLEGWERKGWKEGIHYVTDIRPPSNFGLPYKPVQSYKHTISTFTGAFFKIVSQDQPSASAGNSYQHLFNDENKYTDPDKLKKLTPALRGEYVKFGHSVYYRGKTFTTDMPNISEKEFDGILEQESNMNVEQIKMILEISIELNKIKTEWYRAYKFRDKAKLERLTKRLLKWKEYWIRARKNSTLFIVASSFANVDILTQGYFQDSLESFGIEDFKTSIISLKPSIKKGERFYINLSDHHFYDDGVSSGFYDSFNLIDHIKPTSKALRYCDSDQKLEAGVDFGDMCSMITAQPRGKYIYLLKNFYTLAPEEAPQLAMKFREFFRDHKRKELDLYYDRSGNQNSQTNRDWASDLKYHIEYENGSPTKWRVNMMSLNQRTIYQDEEHFFMKNLLGETVPGLPLVKIDRFQCRETKSSLELAKVVVKNDRKGTKRIGKDKLSEQLPLKQRPLYSTNLSDAFKYLMCRTAWMKLSGRRRSTHVG